MKKVSLILFVMILSGDLDLPAAPGQPAQQAEEAVQEAVQEVEQAVEEAADEVEAEAEEAVASS